MATLTAQVAVRAGLTMTTAAAAGGGDQFANTGREILYYKNSSGSTITLTFAPAGIPGGLSLASYTVAIAAGAEKLIGPFDTSLFNNSSGYVTITYSGVTTLTVAVIQVTGG